MPGWRSLRAYPGERKCDATVVGIRRDQSLIALKRIHTDHVPGVQPLNSGDGLERIVTVNRIRNGLTKIATHTGWQRDIVFPKNAKAARPRRPSGILPKRSRRR